MQKPLISLQDSYLEKLKQGKTAVTMRLVTGAEIKGIVRGYDNFTVILLADGHEVLIYKHALSTVSSEEPVLAI